MPQAPQHHSPQGPPTPHAPGPLSSKLNPPGATATQVRRQALGERFAAAGGVKLVLVRAPAGFGKTTAMVQARDRLARLGIGTAWLTLDRTDNDLPRFLACLRQAVALIVATGLGDAPASEAPLALVDALARHDTPFALFLDDFELITEPAVLGLVREIINHLPRGGQLVLSTRSLPDLGLGRLRAAGQLLEIDTDHLRFSLDETLQFFALRGLGAGGSANLANSATAATSATSANTTTTASEASALVAQVGHLHRKTEGWIAALWLASMALDAVINRHGSVADFIHQFSGSNRAVADYLAEDVLARQTPEIRGFLLRTSLLRQFNAPLCQALNPRADSRRILDQLDAANLFITPISQNATQHATQHATQNTASDEREWRYHSLFADFLRAQLAREWPDELARLHLAASGWYESQGRPVPAIDHAIEGGDAPHAMHLLAQHALVFLEQGRMRLLARWFAALPVALLPAQPMLQVVSLWACTLTRGPWEAMEQLRQSGCEHSTHAAVRAHVNALQPMLLAMMDRVEEARAIGREHLARVPTGQPFADSVLCNAMAHVLGVMGERAEAQRLLDAARRGQQGQGFNRMYSDSIEGLLDLQQGRQRQATARFRLAAGAAGGLSAEGAYPPSHGNAWAGVLYAGAVYEANQLALAEQLLNIYLPQARDVGLPDHMILSHNMRSRIHFLRGDIDAALHALTELEYLGHHRQLPRVVASARLERARLLGHQGQADAAAQMLDRADDAPVWQRVAQYQMTAHDVDDLAIGRLRWTARWGDAAAAARSAATLAEQARAANRQRRALKLQVLQALALQRAGDLAGATALMVAVLQAACNEGFVRLLLDEGPAVGRLLRRVWLWRCATRESPPEAPQDGPRDKPLNPAHRTADPIFDDYLQGLMQVAAAEGDAGTDELDSSPQAAFDGLSTLPVIASSLGNPGRPGAETPTEPLTRKEVRVLQLLAEGYSNGAMAEKLFVSDSTVRTHLRNINMKLGATSRTQAVAIARRLAVIR